MKYYIDCYSRLESMCHRITMKSSFAPNVVQLFRNILNFIFLFYTQAKCCLSFARVRGKEKKTILCVILGGDSEKHNSVKYVAWHGTLCDDELCQT